MSRKKGPPAYRQAAVRLRRVNAELKPLIEEKEKLLQALVANCAHAEVIERTKDRRRHCAGCGASDAPNIGPGMRPPKLDGAKKVRRLDPEAFMLEVRRIDKATGWDL
jgi:hypothetical protein